MVHSRHSHDQESWAILRSLKVPKILFVVFAVIGVAAFRFRTRVRSKESLDELCH